MLQDGSSIGIANMFSPHMCWLGLLQDQPLCCLAYMNGNILACINDGVADPMSDEPDRDANTQLVCIAVGCWPFMFVVATHDIEPGQVLICA